ncbi:MAG TPA: hypothetical protein VGG27_15315 [Magnetospirillaceae bacterium]|jgi:hypothetical protein
MNETPKFDFRDLMAVAAQIHDQGVPAKHAPHLACEWSRDVGTGRMECHWVTDLPQQ